MNTMAKEYISAANAPKAVGPYSHAVKVGQTLYLSGQIPLNAQTGQVPDGIVAQTQQVLENIKIIIEAAGYSPADIVVCDVFLKDMKDFAKMNEVYAAFFDVFCKQPGKGYPARAAVGVAALPRDVLVEIKATAIK